MATLGSRPRGRRGRRIEPWVLALSGILLLGLGLRLWGIRYGLPFGHQIDEERLYVRGAARMLGDSTLDPNYFDNPPLYTYLVAAALGLSHGAASARELADVAQRGDLFLIARALAAVLGTVSIWLTFIAARRFLDTTVALVAAALMAVAFLPVFYSHVALSNVPAMAAACVCLIGVAGILRRGGRADYALAGVGLGVAAATKYIDGVVLVPLLAAAALAPREGALSRRRGLGLSVALGALAFVICNPYALIDWHHFSTSVLAQRDVVGEDKFGQDPSGGVPYYLWTFTWGIGWVPAVGSVAGAVLLLREDRRAGLVLVPVVPLFILYMGLQTRYFGRWMLPVFPLVCILSAYAGVRAAQRLSAARPRLRPALLAAAAIVLAAQSALYVVHDDRVLSRPHTLNVARTWMLEHVPREAGLITEPFHSGTWSRPWARATHRLPDRGSPDALDYAEQLDAGLVGVYERRGYCWVMASSHYWGIEDAELPALQGYYRALAEDGTVRFSASPWGPIDSRHGPGSDEVAFNYDFAYDFYPLAYDRPGPAVLIYRLHGGRCGRRNAKSPPGDEARQPADTPRS